MLKLILILFSFLVLFTKASRIQRDVGSSQSFYENYTPYTFTIPPLPKFEDPEIKSPPQLYDEDDHRATHNREGLNTRSSLLMFLFMMLGALAIFIVIYVIIRCCHEGKSYNNPSPRPRNSMDRIRSRIRYHQNISSPNRPHDPSPGFRRARNQNEDEGVFAIRLNRDEDVDLRTVSSVIVHNGDERRLGGNHLDLPPTYADSTNNSARSSLRSLQDLSNRSDSGAAGASNSKNRKFPPSYEEALMVVPASTSPANDVAANAPVCQSSGGRSGQSDRSRRGASGSGGSGNNTSGRGNCGSREGISVSRDYGFAETVAGSVSGGSGNHGGVRDESGGGNGRGGDTTVSGGGHGGNGGGSGGDGDGGGDDGGGGGDSGGNGN